MHTQTSVARCIDPDHYLDLSGAVAVTRDDVRAAWECAYAALAKALAQRGPGVKVFIVFGLQGAGKSTWVARQAPQESERTVFFSGPLPSRQHRARAIAVVKAAGGVAIGVWVQLPFEEAVARNAQRRGLARIREEAMRDVWDKLEPPSLDEGFSEVLAVCL